MRAAEIDDSGYYDADADVINKAKLSDTRKRRLTLGALNKLKKLRATRELEMLQRQDTLELLYGQAADQQGGGGGMF